MNHKLCTYLLIVLVISTLSLNAQDFRKTQVLILGTNHLSSVKGVESKHLNRLLDSLSTYKFDVIGIEKMPVELLLDIKNRKSEHWRELFSYFDTRFKKGEYFQNLLKMDYEQAVVLVDSHANLDNLTKLNRIQLMKASLCCYDPWTAALNYGYIDDKTILDTAIVNYLDKFHNSKDEINLIGTNLAKRLNINKLYHIDNLQDESILHHEHPEFMAEYQNSQDKISALLDYSFFQKIDSLQKECINKGDLFDLYKYLNSDAFMKGDKKAQWDIWLKTNFESKADRSRYSLWEMRNLQIAANIMHLVATHPEKKILVIIGASHKSFIENSLKQMTDVKRLKF